MPQATYLRTETRPDDSTLTILSDQGDDLEHAACPCNEDVALCGADVSSTPWADKDRPPVNLCVVCADLVALPCPKCGA
ncbi:hypothetical protein [Streptomyces sp. NPDC057250]|uniref:hypothetical protein n=1 Tax=Streptomyces sp. NPDC057250 TaxID=3346068 RepID=UPI003631800C